MGGPILQWIYHNYNWYAYLVKREIKTHVFLNLVLQKKSDTFWGVYCTVWYKNIITNLQPPLFAQLLTFMHFFLTEPTLFAIQASQGRKLDCRQNCSRGAGLPQVKRTFFDFIEVIFQGGLSALFQCFGQPVDCWVSLSRRQGRVKKTRHHVLFLGAEDNTQELTTILRRLSD